MGVYRYRIEGMSCGGCVGSVTRLLQQSEPDADVTVSLESASAQLTSERVPSFDRMKEALAKAGFTLQEAQAR
ncbi:MAG: heavy-metal-associated domain-containing protein [Calditrichaeota bacterium]|nr:heavy-metal-associated domain-containing protein [Candidatus Cloacimonadota bacterium]MCB1048177.1 heavy-metal-associated domain-containing protein [Calditrichota bacterium]MCB9473628.1 heavy-metal-associated domain-containing protein [Candidatus Delongbacteria bacterium]